MARRNPDSQDALIRELARKAGEHDYAAARQLLRALERAGYEIETVSRPLTLAEIASELGDRDEVVIERLVNVWLNSFINVAAGQEAVASAARVHRIARMVTANVQAEHEVELIDVAPGPSLVDKTLVFRVRARIRREDLEAAQSEDVVDAIVSGLLRRNDLVESATHEFPGYLRVNLVSGRVFVAGDLDAFSDREPSTEPVVWRIDEYENQAAWDYGLSPTSFHAVTIRGEPTAGKAVAGLLRLIQGLRRNRRPPAQRGD